MTRPVLALFAAASLPLSLFAQRARRVSAAARTAETRLRDLGPARAESVGISTERLSRLESAMKHLVDDKQVAGLVTLVERHGKVVEFNAVGQLDARKSDPVQKDSIFRIYSMSKPVTGVAMMMLYEEGKWQLDDPVAKFIPEFADLKVYATDAAGNMPFPDPVHPVTMRQLISHPGGFSHGFFFK